MTADELQTLIEDATTDYALGDTPLALEKLARATAAAPDSFEAWHAVAEINFAQRSLDAARAIRDYVAAEGRDPAAFGVEAIVNFSDGPDRWAARAEAWRQAGATHLCVRTMGQAPVGPATAIATMRQYAEAMGIEG